MAKMHQQYIIALASDSQFIIWSSLVHYLFHYLVSPHSSFSWQFRLFITRVVVNKIFPPFPLRLPPLHFLLRFHLQLLLFLLLLFHLLFHLLFFFSIIFIFFVFFFISIICFFFYIFLYFFFLSSIFFFFFFFFYFFLFFFSFFFYFLLTLLLSILFVLLPLNFSLPYSLFSHKTQGVRHMAQDKVLETRHTIQDVRDRT